MFHVTGWDISLVTRSHLYSRLIRTPVSLGLNGVTIRTVDYSLIWEHFLGSHVTHHCGAPAVQVLL